MPGPGPIALVERSELAPDPTDGLLARTYPVLPGPEGIYDEAARRVSHSSPNDPPGSSSEPEPK